MSRRQILAAMGAGTLSLLWRLRATARDDDLPAPRFLLEWGQRGKGEGEFDACVGIAIGKNDEVYTAEFRNQRVQRFTPEGKFLSQFAVQPHAGGLAVDADGNVYVAHWNSNKVAAYSSSGALLRTWGEKGTADGEFQLPGSIAIGPDGLLYVPDQGNSRVQKFTQEGKFVGKWGEHGSEPGQFGGGQPVGGRFAGPQFVAFDRAGNVYTTDAALDRVQKFTPEGELLAFWGSESAEPVGLALLHATRTVPRAREAPSRCALTGAIASGLAPRTTGSSSSQTMANTFAVWEAKGQNPDTSACPMESSWTRAAASTSRTP